MESEIKSSEAVKYFKNKEASRIKYWESGKYYEITGEN